MKNHGKNKSRRAAKEAGTETSSVEPGEKKVDSDEDAGNPQLLEVKKMMERMMVPKELRKEPCREPYTKKYVLTGGPGSGKSSIILALEQMGEYTVREVAEDYIRYRQAAGVKEPWMEKDFQDKILKTQLKREARIHPDARRVFLDRGIHDGLAYVMPGTETYGRIAREAERILYDKIFLIEPLDFTETTETRRENRKEAMVLGYKLEQVYRYYGYTPITIRAGPLEQRVKEILKNIR